MYFVKQNSMATGDGSTKVNDVQGKASASPRSEKSIKQLRNGVILVPQPSDDPRDPLVCLIDIGYENLNASTNQIPRTELASVEKDSYLWDIGPRSICWSCLGISQSIGVCCAGQAISQGTD